MAFKRKLLLSGLAVAIALGGWANAACAAETVVLRYGIFRGSLPMSDLTEFAETGAESPRLSRYLRMANQQPAELQKLLNRQISTEPRSFNLLLSSPAGNALLGEMSRYIYSPERDDQAKLRTALDSSVTDDQVSLLELLTNYPTEEVHINVRRAIATYKEATSIQAQVDSVLEGGLGEILREIQRR